MLKHLLRFTVVALLVSFATAVSAEDLSSLIGQKIYPKDDCKIRNGTKEIDRATVRTPYVVQAVRGDWLDVGPGFVQRQDVRTLNEELAYHTDVIRWRQAFSGDYISRGGVWSDMGEWEFALEDYCKAISLNPKNELGFNQAAWLLATCPVERLRDGKRAVELATTACKLTADSDPVYLDTLAAAYAEAGDFQSAYRTQRKAAALAPSNHKNDIESRLKLYEHRRPYREGEPGVVAMRDPSELPPIAGVRRTASPATILVDEEQTEAVVKKLGPTRPQELPPTPKSN